MLLPIDIRVYSYSIPKPDVAIKPQRHRTGVSVVARGARSGEAYFRVL